jgi:glycosyltransferase involved in cell wall biosynthesis
LEESNLVKEEMDKVNCIVLPSYREGLSKVLIEASSMSLPIVTTNVRGCKDVVLYGETSFLCKVRDSVDLAIQMERIMSLSVDELNLMGVKGRKRAIEVFD